MGLGGFVKGALGGALGGSAFGPIGAIGGGLLGGFLGGQGGGGPDPRLAQYYNEASNRQAPQAGPAAQGAYSGFRGNQAGLISRLEAMSQGQGPSLATEMLKQSTDRAGAQQYGMALSGRGNPAAAQFTAANNVGMLQAQAAQEAAASRIREQQMALQQLGLNIHGARDQDEGMNRFNAGQTNQMAMANLDAQLRQTGMNDQARLQILAQYGEQNAQPDMGDQLLAGGAGMFAQGASMRSMQRMGQPQPGQGQYGAQNPAWNQGAPGSDWYM